MMGNMFDERQLMMVVESHLRELRAEASERRQLHVERQPRRVRRQVGLLLITAGQALTR